MPISKKNKILKKRKTNKKKRSYRKTLRNKRYYKTKQRGGDNFFDGYWITSDQITDPEEKCGICLVDFVKTPNCAIYVTNCGHKFHNNCLLNNFEYCKKEKIPISCPICRQNIGFGDNHVYQFKKKAIANPNKFKQIQENEKLLDIYNNYNGEAEKCSSEIEKIDL